MTGTSPKSVVMMAGGTGGHVFPALALAQDLRGRGHEVTWMGTAEGLEARVVPTQGFDLDLVRVQGVRSSGLSRLLAAPFVIARAMWQAFRILRRRRPSLVVGMGGFVTGPGGVMARILGTPLVIHEQNAAPGLTNRMLARIATRVLAAFPGAFRSPDAVTGNPVRTEITSLPSPAERFADRAGALRVLVMGGSLGAQALNEKVPEALALLAPEGRPEVRHQAGRGKADAARAAYEVAGVTAQVTEFIEDVAEALGWADLVICRAGALTVSELAAAGVASVLVPYPYAVDDHQSANARVLSNAGAAQLVQQRDLSARLLADWLSAQNRDGLRAMAERARGCAVPDATDRVADICEEVMR